MCRPLCYSVKMLALEIVLKLEISTYFLSQKQDCSPKHRSLSVLCHLTTDANVKHRQNSQ